MIVQIVAEELGLTSDDVQLISADTEVTPSDPGSYSMCETFIGGNAVRLAAQDVKKKLFRIAATEFGVGEEDLSANNHKIFVSKDPQQYEHCKGCTHGARGLPSLGKPTHYEARDGRY